MSRTIYQWPIVAALLLMAGSASAAEHEPSGVSSLSRITIIVDDMEQSLELFRDTLGLNVRFDLVLDSDAVNQVMGTQDQRMRIVILQSGNSVVGNVGLLTYLDKPKIRRAPNDRTLDVGEIVLVMETNDIHGIHKQVAARGYSIITPPIVLFPQPDSVEQPKEMVFVGPSGVAINIIQRRSSTD